jgi:hypothetical protein
MVFANESSDITRDLRSSKSSNIAGYQRIPSGYVKIAIEKGPFIVALPIKDGDFP